MRQLRAKRRNRHAGRHDEQCADQRDVTERKRKLQRGDFGKFRSLGPARINVSESRRNGDDDTEAGRRCDRLVNRAPVKRHQQVRQLAAANAHQGRQHADDDTVNPH